MTSTEARAMFFKATPPLVLALVGAYWFANEARRDAERDAAINTLNALTARVEANSGRLSDHDIQLAVIQDRLQREAQPPMVK